jgi:pilus assembly protein Flp/PilA
VRYHENRLTKAARLGPCPAVSLIGRLMNNPVRTFGRHMSKERNQLMFAYMFALLERVKVDRRGVTALEYGVIAAAIIVAIAGVVTTLGTNIAAKFTAVSGAL